MRGTSSIASDSASANVTFERTADESRPVELSILMPCLNEAETIETCVLKAKHFLAHNAVWGEVLVADNGSTDGSPALAEKHGARVVRVLERGYGAALIAGISAARGCYVIMADADDSYDFSNLLPFLEQLRAGCDLVMGNRFLGGIYPGAMPLLHRYLGNPVLSFLGRLFFRIPVGDFHCGLRGFRRSAILDLDLKTTGMEFASEMVVRSGLQRLNMTEVPTTLRPDGRSRSPHLRTWRDGWRHLKFLLIFSPKWLFVYPGLLLSGLGLTLCLSLMFGPVHLSPGVSLDLKSFLAACLFTIMGVQLVTFGILARYYATVKGILPKGPRANRIVAWCKTDRVVLVAVALIVVGGCLFAGAFYQWALVDFGILTNPLIPRLVVAGLSTVVVGIQICFAGFLFGIFDIEISRRTPS
jgi:Glycosyl transferase family 2